MQIQTCLRWVEYGLGWRVGSIFAIPSSTMECHDITQLSFVCGLNRKGIGMTHREFCTIYGAIHYVQWLDK